MRIPWGFLFVGGGLILVYGVDGYDTIGWILVAMGAAMFIFTLLVFAFMAWAVANADTDMKYTTNFGRKRPLKK